MRDFCGLRLLYTRDARHLAALREALPGADIEHWPLMASRGRNLSAAELQAWQDCDALIFTSAAAVRFAPSLPPHCQAVAIGEATAAALARPALVAPPPFNSEALLAHWQPRGLRIGLVAAPGGRQHLAEHLRPYNEVRFFYVYERFNPSPSLPADFPTPRLVTIASQQTLKHLLQCLNSHQQALWKSAVAIAAMSPRVAQYAAAQGFSEVFHGERAQESAIIQAIIGWWQHQRGIDGRAAQGNRTGH